MQDKTYQHKKRIIFTALSPYFADQKLMQTMLLWEKKYSHLPSSAVQHFVYDIRNTIDPEADIRGIHLNLIKAGSLPESKLLEDPSDLISRFTEENNISAQAEFSLPEITTTLLFIQKWQQQLSPLQNDNVINYMIENINSQNIDQMLSVYFVSWLQDPNSKVKIANVNISDLRKIINLFYIGCCEFIGPVKADQLLAITVKKLKANGGANYATIINQLI